MGRRSPSTPCWAAVAMTRDINFFAGPSGWKLWICNFVHVFLPDSQRTCAWRTSIAEDSFTWWMHRCGTPGCGLRPPTSSTPPVPLGWKRPNWWSRPRADRRPCACRTTGLRHPFHRPLSPQPHVKPSRLRSHPVTMYRRGRTLPDCPPFLPDPFGAAVKNAKGACYRPQRGGRLRSQGFFVNFL